jgi:hypothetical protein
MRFSTASSTVQRPSPESSTNGASAARSLPSCSKARAASSQSHERTTEPYPEVGDLGVVELVLTGVEEREALRVGLHHPVLHPVVDHLHVVAGAGGAEVPPAGAVLVVRGRREHVEDGREALDGLVGPPDHHAVADLESPDAAARPHVDVVDPARPELPGAALVVAPSRVAAVDDGVALREQPGKRLHGLLGRVAGGHHDPHRARGLEFGYELLERRGPRRAMALGFADGVLVEVEGHDRVVRVAVDAMDHVGAHLAETDEAELHQNNLPTASTGSPSSSTRTAFKP